MSNSLTVETEEPIDPLLQRSPFRLGPPQPPFSERSCHISLLLQEFAERHRIRWYRVLAFRLGFAIVTNKGMPGMKSRHQHTTRRSTHGVPGVVLGQAHSVLCQLIQIGGANFLLPKAPQISISKIIRQNKDDIGPGIPRCSGRFSPPGVSTTGDQRNPQQ